MEQSRSVLDDFSRTLRRCEGLRASALYGGCAVLKKRFLADVWLPQFNWPFQHACLDVVAHAER